jgi:carboxylesterase type B
MHMVLQGLTLTSTFLGCSAFPTASAPTVEVLNGSYYGIYNSHYKQDFFLGIPYTQPPVGELRFRTPQPLNISWITPRNATEYSPMCVGYNQTIGASENCLTLNVVRPSGVGVQDKLPVAGKLDPVIFRSILISH